MVHLLIVFEVKDSCMFHFFLISVFLLHGTMAQAVIIAVDYIKNTMPEFNAEKFILFHDYHVHTPEDKQQLAALTHALIKRDQESTQEMHILVEQPAGTPFFYSVMGHIKDTLRHCVHTRVENIEMRCFTGTACDILNPKKDPYTICGDYFGESAYAACRFGSITMQEIDIEIKEYKDKVDAWLQTMSPRYAEMVRVHEYEFQDCLKDYKHACTMFNVTPETNVLQLSRDLFRRNPYDRAHLYKMIDDLAAVLFDFYIAKCILSLHKPDIIALVAGSSHAGRVYGLLKGLGNKTIACYGKTVGPDIRPLPEYHLDIDPGCCSCCWMCPIQ